MKTETIKALELKLQRTDDPTLMKSLKEKINALKGNKEVLK